MSRLAGLITKRDAKGQAPWSSGILLHSAARESSPLAHERFRPSSFTRSLPPLDGQAIARPWTARRRGRELPWHRSPPGRGGTTKETASVRFPAVLACTSHWSIPREGGESEVGEGSESGLGGRNLHVAS
jgi:hypothetical protein